jgi:hypothetical protein
VNTGPQLRDKPSLTQLRSKLCASYDGHVYLTDGWRTTTLTVTWAAAFSIDGGTNFQTIAGAPITGPASTTRFHVRSTHTVLVDNGR